MKRTVNVVRYDSGDKVMIIYPGDMKVIIDVDDVDSAIVDEIKFLFDCLKLRYKISKKDMDNYKEILDYFSDSSSKG